MINEAVGIAINGQEAKIAHVHRDKHRLIVDYLESSALVTDMEYEVRKKAEEEAAPPVVQSEDDLFAIKETQEGKAVPTKESSLRENTDVIYSLLRRFGSRRTRVGFNIPPSLVSYQDTEARLDFDKNIFKGTFKKKIGQWKGGFNVIDNFPVITRSDGTLCNVVSEIKEPPLVDILEQLNSYFKGNLVLTLMDPNEVALVNLARNSYDLRDGSKITAIIQIEAEFSRIIFMRGDDLLTVSPIIPESFNPDIFSIVYSKVIYELDNLNLPEVNVVLLAGKASTNAAKTFFEKKFPDAKVGFIFSQPLAEIISSQFTREELSEYAIPISLAWKSIQKKGENFIPTNLLPSQIIERQKVLSLTLAGYVLLVLLGISAFTLTWKITAKKIEASSLKAKNQSLIERINTTEETVKKVRALEDEISKIKKRLVLSDSLSQGSDRLLGFLEQMNLSVSRIRSVWIEDVQSTQTGILIRGKSAKRGDIPRLSEELGNARINKLIRADEGSQRLFSFEMVVDWQQQPPRPNSRIRTEPGSAPPLKVEANNSELALANPPEVKTVTPTTQTVAAERNIGIAQQSKTAPSLESLSHNSQNKTDRPTNKPGFASSEPKNQQVPKIENIPKSQPMSLEKKTDFADNQTESFKKANENLRESGTRFIIAVNAHANKLTAKRDVQNFRAKGFDAYITTLPNSTREVPYWVCIGDFNNYEDAEQELSRVNRSIPGKHFIIKISKDEIIKSSGSQLKTDSFSSPNNSSSQFIKRADHATFVTNEDIADHGKSAVNVSNSERYVISISTHATKETAAKEIARYRSKGFKAYARISGQSTQKTPYWVCYGNFASRTEAEQEMKRLSVVIPGKYRIVQQTELTR